MSPSGLPGPTDAAKLARQLDRSAGVVHLQQGQAYTPQFARCAGVDQVQHPGECTLQ